MHRADASALEECRAEAVGLVLSAQPAALAVFGAAPPPAAGDVADVTFVNWLWMARAGLKASDPWDRPTKQGGPKSARLRAARPPPRSQPFRLERERIRH
jgi:hypothetical protein